MKAFQKFKNILGILLCIVMTPILSINLAWIIQSYVHPDQIPSIFNYMVFVVTTDSMSPAISGGDVVIAKKTEPAALSEGDIITFYDPAATGGFVVTHRISHIRKNPDGALLFETKGDANSMADEELVPEEKLIGNTCCIIPKIGKFILFLQTTEGVLCFVTIPLAIFAIYLTARQKKPSDGDGDKGNREAKNGRPRAAFINEEKERTQ